MSSAVRVQIHFTDFKIAVKKTTICPQFNDVELTTNGCYTCPMLARISFKAHSTCEPGTVSVHLQEITVHMKALRLESEPTLHIVKFYTENQCYTEKLCLKSSTLIQCQTIKFCLEEPTVELMNLNTNYTTRHSMQTTQSWSNWLQLPTFNSSLFFLKFIGSALFIICLLITTISTVLTCCCRSR